MRGNSSARGGNPLHFHEMPQMRDGHDTGFLTSMSQNHDAAGITPAKENYLKAILELSDSEETHSTDIANALGVSRASVSRMMGILKEDGYVAKEKYGAITLTERGRKAAAYVRKRHRLLKSFLADVLGVEDAVATEDACRMEHVISFETVEKLSRKLGALSECMKPGTNHSETGR